MNTEPSLINRYSVPIFLILTPLISILIAVYLPLPPFVVVSLAAIEVTLMAVLLAAIAEGSRSVVALLRKLIEWRIGFKWYIVALGLPLVIQLAMSVLALTLGWIPAIHIRPWSSTQLILGVVILILAVFEEIGWRGYALSRLLTYRSALVSALLIGISWGIFHIGLGALENRPWLPTFLAPFTASLAFTWLFVQTRGNLITAILFHFGLNYFTFFNEGIPIDQLIWLQVIVSLALALLLILVYGVNLQRGAANEADVVDAVRLGAK